VGSVGEREREDEREDVGTRADGYLRKAIKMASLESCRFLELHNSVFPYQK